MSGIIEIVFEGLKIDHLESALDELSLKGELIEKNSFASYDVIEREVDLNEESVKALFQSNQDSSLFLNLKHISFGKLKLPSPIVRVIDFEGRYDLEINVDMADTAVTLNGKLISEMKTFAEEFAKKYDLKSYAGYDQSVDEDKPLFSGKVA
jgi:hypothetical protein